MKGWKILAEYLITRKNYTFELHNTRGSATKSLKSLFGKKRELFASKSGWKNTWTLKPDN